MSTPSNTCTQTSHEACKTDSQFPKLAYVGEQRLGGLVLELRNCSCGTTLARLLEEEDR